MGSCISERIKMLNCIYCLIQSEYTYYSQEKKIDLFGSKSIFRLK